VCHAQASKPAAVTPPAATSKSTATHHTSSASSKSPSSSHHPVASSAHSKATSKSRKRKRTASWRTRGQQKIDPQRAHDIQDALIREHYLEGTPSGVWDDTTQKAMQKYQADHGWQSTMTPDSRALIKLGLGPDHAHLLNPESAMTMSGGGDPPQSSHADPPAAASPSTVASPSVPVSSTPLPAQDPAAEQDTPKK
jgi:hypothetical protein